MERDAQTFGMERQGTTTVIRMGDFEALAAWYAAHSPNSTGTTAGRQEVADHLGVSIATVYYQLATHLRRARRHLLNENKRDTVTCSCGAILHVTNRGE